MRIEISESQSKKRENLACFFNSQICFIRSELVFDSSFESGNLQMAVKVAPFEYSLILETDVNAPLGRHNQVI